MGGKPAHRRPQRSVNDRVPVGFQASSKSGRALPDPEESSDWYVWEIWLAAPDGEDHVWLVLSGIIDQDLIADQLLSSDPDFREIVTVRGRARSDPNIVFNRYPFDQPYQSQRFTGYDIARAVAIYRALVLWEEGRIPHLPEH